jgi:hypothetical protein
MSKPRTFEAPDGFPSTPIWEFFEKQDKPYDDDDDDDDDEDDFVFTRENKK